jgi:hypothetical protein
LENAGLGAVMTFRNSLIIGLFLLGMCGSTAALADGNLMSLSSDVHGCKISLGVFSGENGNLVLQLDLANYCNVELKQKISTLDELLEKMALKHVDFSKLKSLMIGRVVQPEWNEKIAECYLASPYARDRGKNVVLFVSHFDKCDAFSELRGVFQKHNFLLSHSSIEELDIVNFRSLTDAPTNLAFFRKTWIRRHKIDEDVVYGGIVFFQMTYVKDHPN